MDKQLSGLQINNDLALNLFGKHAIELNELEWNYLESFWNAHFKIGKLYNKLLVEAIDDQIKRLDDELNTIQKKAMGI